MPPEGDSLGCLLTLGMLPVTELLPAGPGLQQRLIPDARHCTYTSINDVALMKSSVIQEAQESLQCVSRLSLPVH